MISQAHEDVLTRLERVANAAPSTPLFTFVDEAGRDAGSLDAGSLLAQADALSAELTERHGLREGDRAMLVYTPSLAFVVALVGCMRAGIVPVPVPPPDPRRAAHDLARLDAMVTSSGAKALLTNREYERARLASRLELRVRGVFGRPQPSWPSLPWIVTDEVRLFSPRSRPARAAQGRPRGPSEIALLQYTSGSTSSPKGVVITHGNLAHQLSSNARDLGLGPASVMVSWVPHFHDFGLISGIASALWGNGRMYFLSPLSFVQRPAVWPEVMTRVRATHTAAPNFAYELVVRKTTAEARRGYDLRSLRVAMSAAEPIKHETVEAFVRAFAPSGMSPEAFCPAYGLAEHTVGVTVGGRGTIAATRASLSRMGERALVERCDPAEGRVLVGCGSPAADTRVRVVDPETRRALPEGAIGEIWVDSPSKAAGYFGLPDATRETFQARLEGDPAEYLRTGDLGFFHGGQIFITGRLKDLVIVRGRNLYPEDVEASARGADDRVRPGGVAAFGCDGGEGEERGERLVVVVELREPRRDGAEAPAVARAVAASVSADHGVSCEVLVGRQGMVPRTTSGKVQRRACRAAYEGGELTALVLHRLRPSPEPLGEIAAPTAGPSAEPPPARLDEGLDADFAALVARTSAFFAARSSSQGDRVFHRSATTLRGVLEPCPDPRLPAHAFFAEGARYPVLVRHANGVLDDDAATDNRGATVRVLDPDARGDLARPLLDLLLTTGECFLAATAEDFARWMAATPAERDAIALARPEVSAAAWSMFRRPTSYASLHYHAKTAQRFVADDGSRFFARFRLVPPGGAPDTGFVAPDPARPVPPEGLGRDPTDPRSPRFLHDELRTRLASSGRIAYELQVQLRPEADGPEALDATRPWPADRFAPLTVARLELDAVVDEAAIEGLRFSPANAPASLSLPLARSPRDPASLAQLRAIVYERAAQAREASRARRPLRVAVIGAGVSGLCAALELEKRGHRAVVFERAPHVAGKSASIEVDGLAFDLGGHVCTGNYPTVASLVDEVGAAIEPATPTFHLSLATREISPPAEPGALRDQLARYLALRRSEHASLDQPGLAAAAPGLSMPASAWFARHGLAELGALVGLHFVACGYGDPREVPALYVLRAAEAAGMLGPPSRRDLPPAWCVSGGFADLWRRVAARLSDVRLGVGVRAIERGRGPAVTVHADDGSSHPFDAVVVAVPPDAALSLLDASPDERSALGALETLDYVTVVARAPGVPEGGFFLVREHCHEPARWPGHAVAFHQRYPGSDVVLLYAYAPPGMTDAEIESRLRSDVERAGGRLEQVISVHRWVYSPHADAEALAGGALARIEALQGARSTYFAGASLCFELVECNAAYARDLVRTHFADLRAPSATSEGSRVKASPRAPSGGHAALVQRLLSELSGGSSMVDPSASFDSLGLDSIRSVDLFQRIAAETGLRLEPVALLDHPTVASLGAHLDSLAGEPAGAAARRPAIDGQGPSEGAAIGGRSRTTALYTQHLDVVYGESFGLACVLDVFVPRAGRGNGLAVIDVASALWNSGRDVIDDHASQGTYDALCAEGFVVFAVRPGSRSRLLAADMIRNLQVAIHWVRDEGAARFGADPARVGLIGGSAGGHLACMAAVSDDEGPLAGGPRRPSPVQALVAFCPLTDARPSPATAGSPRREALLRELVGGGERGSDLQPVLGDASAAVSPLARVERAPPPTLLLHGVRDRVVPFDQSSAFAEALRSAGAHVELVERDTDQHPWASLGADLRVAARWLKLALGGAPRSFASLEREAAPARPVRPAHPAGRTGERGGGWFLRPAPVAEPRARLFCLPHAGGSAEMYRAWADLLPDGIELLAVQLPGRPPRESERALADMNELLDALSAEILPLLDRPYALFGHSLGSIVAYELTRRLSALAGVRPPLRLFVSAFGAPQLFDPAKDALGARLAQASGTALLAPPTRADVEAFRSWRYRGERPLEVPITALGGEHDPLVGRDGLLAWSEQTRAGFDLVLLDGGHHYIDDQARAVVDRVAASLEPALGGPRAPAEAIAGLAERWRASPHALTGPWQRFDLCWLARIPHPLDDARPCFPAALDRLIDAERDEAARSPSAPHPYPDLVVSLALAVTAAGRADPRCEPAFERAVARALEALEALRNAGRPSPHEQGPASVRFPGFLGRWLVPAHEAHALLERAAPRLSPEARRSLGSLTSASLRSFSSDSHQPDFEGWLERGTLALHFAEYFPEESLRSPAAHAHAGRALDLPCLTAAGAARFAWATGDERALARLGALLARPDDGLRPGGRLQEAQFALMYLARAGVDVATLFAPELAYVRSTLGLQGSPVEGDVGEPDCDGTAVALRVHHALDLPSPFPTEALDSFWNPARRAYQSADGRDSPAISTALHVLGATLEAPDVSPAHAERVFRRTVELLEPCPWVEPSHLSPFYVWEKVVSLFFAHADRFPKVTTRAHHHAIARILEHHDPGTGGFFAALPDRRATLEETAFALIALRSALASPALDDVTRARALAAQSSGRGFLRRTFPELTSPRARLPALWAAKLTYAPRNLVEAIAVAALHAP